MLFEVCLSCSNGSIRRVPLGAASKKEAISIAKSLPQAARNYNPIVYVRHISEADYIDLLEEDRFCGSLEEVA